LTINWRFGKVYANIEEFIMNISWFSAGVSSFIATYLVRDEIDQILYTHIDDQHLDSIRFIQDCSTALNKEIIILQNIYHKNVESVCRAFKFIKSPKGAKCTEKLKKEVRKYWEYENGKGHTYIWGLDCTETGRAERIKEVMSNFQHRFPLIENNLTKEDAHGMCAKLGVKRPAMYDMGYHNNNCIGCLKGGMGYWNKIRKDFPDVFASRAKMERDVGHHCLKDYFLDELPLNVGRHEKPITEDCSIACELNLI
jgi:hypothetical protein